MSFRSLDKKLINLFGIPYLKAMWMRSYLFGRKGINVMSPISVSDRRYDNMLTSPSEMFIAKLQKSKQLPAFYNGCNFFGADLAAYDYLLRELNPSSIVEIGAGGSTQFAYYRTSEKVNLITIDPEPRTIIPVSPKINFIKEICQNVPVRQFGVLQNNDILFIDSSHYEEEALYHVNEILPRLNSGVYIHHHDIYYPYDVNPKWKEQSVILDFYYRNQDKYEIIFPAAFAFYYNNWFFRKELKISSKLNLNVIPSSLWTRKK